MKCKYNEKRSEFTHPDAIKTFLSPIGLYDKPLTPAFAQNDTQLTSVQEREHFEALHFVKFRLHCAQVNKHRVAFWHNLYVALRNRLVVANTGLIYGCIRKSSSASAAIDKSDFISAGHMTLMKTVDNFDPWRSFRFSTYACRALLHEFVRIATQNNSGTIDVTQVDAPEKLPDTDHGTEFAIDRLQVALTKAQLTQQERDILHKRFFEGKILDDVGEFYGVSKERARQIQVKALDKIRKVMDKDSVFCAL